MSTNSATARSMPVSNATPFTFKDRLFATLKIWAFGITQVPLIFFARPRAVEVTEKRCEICIPLKYRTKNHVGSMYFGTLAIGADLCVGLLALRVVEKMGAKMLPVFKDFQCDFKKLAKGDVHFITEEGDAVTRTIEQALATGERQNLPVKGYATVPSVDPIEKVMEFTLTLSVKDLSKKK